MTTTTITISDSEREIVRKAQHLILHICKESLDSSFPATREIAIRAIGAIEDLGLNLNVGADWESSKPGN